MALPSNSIISFNLFVRGIFTSLKIKAYFKLDAPINQIKEYDRAIKMLEMSVDNDITLSEQEFAEYVLDDWHWKNQFTLTNSAYLAHS